MHVVNFPRHNLQDKGCTQLSVLCHGNCYMRAATWGIIEVKGAWQLSLPESMSLAAATEHRDYCKKMLPALQQVCTMISAKVQSSNVHCPCAILMTRVKLGV